MNQKWFPFNVECISYSNFGDRQKRMQNTSKCTRLQDTQHKGKAIAKIKQWSSCIVFPQVMYFACLSPKPKTTRSLLSIQLRKQQTEAIKISFSDKNNIQQKHQFNATTRKNRVLFLRLVQLLPLYHQRRDKLVEDEVERLCHGAESVLPQCLSGFLHLDMRLQ